tara:strand:+ start:200 stop:394 length:195 start_codon:yes stop_codon:yes gene_type:complete
MENKGKTSNICYGGGFYTGSFLKTDKNNVKINKANIEKIKLLYEKFIKVEEDIYKMKNISYSYY